MTDSNSSDDYVSVIASALLGSEQNENVYCFKERKKRKQWVCLILEKIKKRD